MLQADLDYEYHTVVVLKKAIAACETAQDYVTRDMLAIQLEDTEMDHAYYLEKQLRLIELVGREEHQRTPWRRHDDESSHADGGERGACVHDARRRQHRLHLRPDECGGRVLLG
jgi:hypothetical protein